MVKKPAVLPHSQKLIAIILIGAAGFGWLISLSGLTLLWLSYRPVKQAATELLEVTGGALEVSSQTILLLENSLIQAEDSLAEVYATLNGFSAVMESTSAALDLASQVLGNEFIRILEDTSTGLEGLERTSRLIDNTLGFISSIPFFGGGPYKPEVPLAESVANIRRDLGGMSPALEQVSGQIKETSLGLQPLPEAMSNLTAQLTGIQRNLSETRKQLDEYQAIIESYQTQVERFKNNLPVIITGLYAALSVLLVWVALAQVGLLTQGLERLGRIQPGRAAGEAEPAE